MINKDKGISNHIKIKDLPESERPYEKMKRYGASYLSDAEILAVIIKTGTPKLQSVEVAQRVLGINKYEKGITGLYKLSLEQLKQVEGIGDIKALQIMAMLEFSKRATKQEAIKGFKADAPRIVAEIYMEEMRHLQQEHFKIVYLDTKKRIIGDQNITIGTLNSTIVHPREVFREAIKCNASDIIAIHNHPSGDPSPSNADIEVTKRIDYVGKMIGIGLVDHIIIGDNKYISLKEMNYLK